MPNFELNFLYFLTKENTVLSYYRPLCGKESIKIVSNMQNNHLFESHCVRGILWAHSKQSVTVLGLRNSNLSRGIETQFDLEMRF